LNWLVVAALAVACRGRSSLERVNGKEPADAGASAGGAAGTETGGTGADPSLGGGTAAGRGGSAGRAGGGQGGTGGAAGDGCTCDEPLGNFTCTRPVEEFCYGPSAFGCPPALSNALANLDAVCQNDGELGLYSECAGGYTELSWTEGGENEYQLFFDGSTGELVGGVVNGYLGGPPDCNAYGFVRAGTTPTSCVASCRFCRELEDQAGAGGEGGLPTCRGG
jgi:hypothetical protein